MWQIHVDESGDFDRPDDLVCVAGVVVRRGTDEAALEARLRAELGFVPWPMHAAHLNVPVFIALAALHSGRAFPGREILTELRDHLQCVAPLPMKDIMAEFVEGRRPDIETLKEVESLVPPRYEPWLNDLQGKFFQHLRRIVASLGGMASAFVAVAAEGGPVPEGDRYPPLLSALARTLAAGVHADPAPRMTWQVLGRQLQGGDMTHRWLRTHLTGAAPGAVEDVEVAAYDHRVGGLLVIADFVANRARRALRCTSRQAVGQTLKARTGLPLWDGHRWLLTTIGSPPDRGWAQAEGEGQP